MTEQPTATLQVWPTADERWRVTCPFHHAVPVIFRDFDAEVAGKAMSAHVDVEHGWKVTGFQVLSEVSRCRPSPRPNLQARDWQPSVPRLSGRARGVRVGHGD